MPEDAPLFCSIGTTPLFRGSERFKRCAYIEIHGMFCRVFRCPVRRVEDPLLFIRNRDPSATRQIRLHARSKSSVRAWREQHADAASSDQPESGVKRVPSGVNEANYSLILISQLARCARGAAPPAPTAVLPTFGSTKKKKKKIRTNKW